MGGQSPQTNTDNITERSGLNKDESIDMKQDKDESERKSDGAQTVSPMGAYFKLWSFADPFDVFLRCLAALAALGSGTAEPLMAIIFGNLVNIFNGDPPVSPEEFRSQVNKNALYFVYLFVGKFACVYTAAVLFNLTASRMAGKIRLRYLRTVLHQPISYFDKNAPGSIATSLANDTNVIQVGLSEKLGIVFQVISMVTSAFIISFTRNWKLTLVTATMVPYMIVSTGFFGGLSTNVETKVNEKLSNASGVAEEALSSILNITAMGAKEKIVQIFDVHLKEATRYFKRIGPLQAGIYGNMFLAVHSAYALSLFYGVKLVSRGEITNGGTVVTVLFCMILASSAMAFLAPLIPDFTKAAASAQKIVKMIGDSKDDKTSQDDGAQLNPETLRGKLEMKEVSFAYPERPTVTVLDNMNLRIPPNKVTAIVGHSGSGKSTIVGLLERWYALGQGSILVDGQDIKDLDLRWWRTQIGLVQQEPMLFNDTIYHNVLNGLRGADFQQLPDAKKRELVINACKQANAHHFIEQLPNGYDTLAGERAGLLSGGQKQRIAVARSIVSNPKVLLLDEATSALDSEAERAVSAALEKASRGRTTVMIAHKLSTVVNANNIVVLNKGIIVEQGTHSELLALGGHYCRLLQAQGSSHDNSGRETPIEDEINQTVSRKLTRTSTKAVYDPTNDITSSIESQEISRRYGILHCVFKIYSEQKSLVAPSILGLIAGMIGGAAFPLQAVFFSRLTTVFVHQGQELIDRGNFWALMFFVLGISQLLAYLVLFSFMGMVGAKIGQVYRRDYLKSMLSQDVGFFQAEGNTSGGLTALLSADGFDVSMLFASNSGLIVIFITNLISCIILAIAVYWKMALVALFGCLPPLLAAGFMRMRMDLTAQDRCATSFLESARYSTEAVAAIRTVSSLTMESKVESMYHQKLQAASASSIKLMMVGMALYALSDTMALAASALAFWYGGRLVSFGELSVTQYFIIFAAVIFGGQSAGLMFGFTSSTNKAHAAMNRMLSLIHSKPPINSSTGVDPKSSPPSSDTPTVEFRDVRFRYPSRPTVPVLRGISLSVSRGSHVCVVGPSGCGKSTLVVLLERFYDLLGSSEDEKVQNSGEICVYGRPIVEWDIIKLRKMMGLVAQDTTLYQGTIRDNILMGIDETEATQSDEDIETRITTACKEANIHDFITSLPQGYATDVGARGVALSGGQRQRLALARCLIRNPEILLLDEATSALDPESEKAVREALTKTRKERERLTVISVTHQVESMRDADYVFVMDKGIVVEEGKWEVLMSRRGRLWSMVVQGEVQGEAH
ncbi:multidrug resistance protein [Zopfia rhizophila CBS 207.26]|uniref:Multidrug resistance protein n=1 Tax=Zopfia rhizophila CBS 207.26 TaxID=1314779 RepID=A0A6A6EAB8_9PEZI|nr:multidrug resistance protein [Zopfia rhizophila CBS 207.26]